MARSDEPEGLGRAGQGGADAPSPAIGTPDGPRAPDAGSVFGGQLPTVGDATAVPAVRFNPLSTKPVRTVFIHGVLASTSMWKSVVAGDLADEAAALPLPGHFPWAIDAEAAGRAFDDLRFLEAYRDWLADAAAGPVHIVAHSAGSVAALKFAALHPDRVGHLTLLGTFGDGPSAVAASLMARTVTLPLVGRPLFERLHRLWLQSADWYNAGLATAKPPPPGPSDQPVRPPSRAERAMLADLRRSDPEALRRAVLWLQQTSVREELAGITTPATVLVCQDDPVVSLDKQMDIVRSLPNATAVVSHVGHLPMFEAPDVLRRIIEGQNEAMFGAAAGRS